ncbi:MAG: bifunctional demethylmenaquinone methyltransferase/2-methoxy-6-polyprenyl-1,4-benzoquinol methylase UbiE [Pseudanabaenaceae cyanobacterium SKYGB_i_bin29]|nr:bifunctional demethylmenaquinone methyltransferase/2-methoxy-6-polyprenyl-1,4-benzoquinol methylase UbiE [Pseudanabaenaceae cyanobacterium SKYG29]MDW8422057.1 bifunctional demethylmenaquinone methyltransferase/2-methoxy-6-polyprenyl-1,4-benzoquinol methylase UbiE [Pseudanabaenaceae cyanobacterium SKYGB_i_bin29]
MSPVADLFNKIAPVYDNLNDALSLGLHRVWKKMVLGWAAPKPGELWLDLCCGSGDMAILLARSGATVIGVDFAPCQLAIAQRKGRNLPNLSWEEGDVLHLRFPDRSVDGVTMTYGLRNLADVRQGLQEIYRVLNTPGRAVILDFHRPYNPVLAGFQRWYLRTIVVPTARQFHLESEYAYLEPSLQKFPQGREQIQLAQQVGFRDIKHYPIVGGMMGILYLNKT